MQEKLTTTAVWTPSGRRVACYVDIAWMSGLWEMNLHYTTAEATAWLRAGPYELWSTVEQAEALSHLCGVEMPSIAYTRAGASLSPGDEALVFYVYLEPLEPAKDFPPGRPLPPPRLRWYRRWH